MRCLLGDRDRCGGARGGGSPTNGAAGAIELLRRVVAEEGVRGLLAGTRAALWRVIYLYIHNSARAPRSGE